jgi:beta-N-acetylhexosaminidase
MATRAVSPDPKKVVVYVREFLRGLHDAGILGCGKHFPGLGEGNLDSHHELPVIQKGWKDLWAEDLYPYRTLKQDYPFVMVCHAAYPAVTRDRTPASLSNKWIRDVLRKKVGYRGLIVSDDLEMGGVLSAAPIEHAALEHIRAGGDIALICHKEEFIVRACEAMIREAEKDRRFAQRIHDSARRILAFKKAQRNLSRFAQPPKPETVDRLSRQLWEFAEQVRLETLSREEQA